MVRIMMKGGTWKNTEDEILKVAVMKYGKMQWARVASLLSRKSAKQCKARWFEWLDPAIKKTEWSREEEEKLLHLAKLMPNQWRTIAPLVGRTAAQCLEHYERLLDMAQEGEGDAGGAGEDSRKLRPGEIDPTPETKPARPDPIDMDEDEKEMLSEARARLSNTKGKKAKRKAREKQLEEARRLANLQKRRELKAAGIERKAGRKKRKYMDYGSEIPFEMKAPAGFHDVSEERVATKKAKMNPENTPKLMHQMEEKRRNEEDAAQRKRDADRLKRLAKVNLPQAVMEVNAANDPLPIRRRTALNLPAPQVTDQELEDIVKLGSAAAVATGGSGQEATQALVGEYAQRPTPTPMRTPATPMGEDVIMQEARNLAKLTAGQTPLLGGENPDLDHGTGFGGSVPNSQRITTPSTLTLHTPGAAKSSETPLRTPGSMAGGTGQTPVQTPLRDQFGLNVEGAEVTPRTKAGKAARSELAAKLAGLPSPQYTYEINVPSDGNDAADSAAQLEEDAAERDARMEAQRLADEEAEFRRRTSVLKRGLPRPVGTHKPEAVSGAEGLIAAEVATLVAHDAAKFPVSTGKKKKKKKKSTAGDADVHIEQFSEEELTNAKLMVEEEVAGGDGGMPQVTDEKFQKTWEECFSRWGFLPDQECWGKVAEASEADLVTSAMHEYQALRLQLDKASRRAEKLEAKLALKHGGYENRAQALLAELKQAQEGVENANIEQACFQMLEEQEATAIPLRVGEARAAAQEEEGIAEKLQLRYAALVDERESIETVALPEAAQ
ncbi:unnamed protein product [Chrysoparadoxa australica]